MKYKKENLLYNVEFLKKEYEQLFERQTLAQMN